MLRILTLVFAVSLLKALGSAFGAEQFVTEEAVGPESYYKCTFKINADALLKEIGLDREKYGRQYFLPGPYGNDPDVGSGVTAPESYDIEVYPVPLILRANKTLGEFLTAKGVGQHPNPKFANSVFFHTDEGTLSAHGSLRYLLEVNAVLNHLKGVVRQNG